MSTYRALLTWQRSASEAFTDQRYSRRHTVTFDGGVVMAASSSPQVVPLPMSDASAVDPEEMFVASLASCHMLWFLSIAAQRGFKVDHYVDDASGEMTRNEEKKWVMSTVLLRPLVTFSGQAPDQQQLGALHHEAHGECFIANSVKTQVLCEPRYSAAT